MPHVVPRAFSRSTHGLKKRTTHDYDASREGVTSSGSEQAFDQSVRDSSLPGLMPGVSVTDLINGPATVTINSDGITIEDGALIIRDEFGETVLVSSGFQGTWSDYLSTGLYNGLFAAAVVGVLADGRSVQLPYWTVSHPVGTPVLTCAVDASYPGGHSLRATFAAHTTTVMVASDPVPVVAGFTYSMTATGAATTTATALNTVRLSMSAGWYDSSGALLSTSTLDYDFLLGATTATFGPSGVYDYKIGATPVVAPDNARHVIIAASLSERLAHNASAWIEIGHVGMMQVTQTLNPNDDYLVYNMTVEPGFLNVGPFAVDSSVGEITTYFGNAPSSYTATVTGGGSATFTSKNGYYYQIGAMVFFQVAIVVNAAGSGSSGITVSIPVAASSTAGTAACIGHRSGAGYPMAGRISASATSIDNIRNDAALQVLGSDLVAGQTFTFSGTYFT